MFDEIKFCKWVILSVCVKEWYNAELPGYTHKMAAGGRGVYTFHAKQRHTKVDAESLSHMWQVGLETAQKMLKAMTQQGVPTALHPITQRYRVDQIHLQHNRLNTAFCTDMLLSQVLSMRGNKCAQILQMACLLQFTHLSQSPRQGLC